MDTPRQKKNKKTKSNIVKTEEENWEPEAVKRYKPDLYRYKFTEHK